MTEGWISWASGLRWPSVEEVKTIGAVAGIASLCWALYQAWGSYLQLDTSIQDAEDMALVGATIENKLVVKRRLAYSLLLVSPKLEDPLETARALAPALAAQIRTQSDIIRLRDHLGHNRDDAKPTYGPDRCRAALPLCYFYREQEFVGDERLKYVYSIDKTLFEPGLYSVRFYVFAKKTILFFARAPWRSTQNILVVSGRPTYVDGDDVA